MVEPASCSSTSRLRRGDGVAALQARAQSAFKGGAPKDAAWTASDATRAVLDGVADAVFRGYDRTSVNTQILAVFDDARTEAPSLAAGQTGFVALRETPFYLEAGGQVSDVGTITAPGGAARVTGVVRAGAVAARARRRGDRGHAERAGPGRAEVTRRDAGRDPPQPHRDSPSPCRAAPGARPARQAGRVARRAGPAALRFRPLQRGHPRAVARDRGDRQRPDSEEHGRHDRGQEHRGGDRGRRDGALRREVWRQCPRRVRRRASAPSCAAARTSAPPATSASLRLPRRAVSPRACAASRPRPGRSRSATSRPRATRSARSAARSTRRPPNSPSAWLRCRTT